MTSLKPLRSILFVLAAAASGQAQVNTVKSIAPDVYFHEGDQTRGHCNNGWIIMDDYVIAVDANYPSGAREVIPKIKAMTAKPIRFVIDTHFHPDHSFGNQLWVDEGAVVVAHAATFAELKKSGAEAWELEAKDRPDVAASKLALPSLVYVDSLAFDDGRHRVELHWFGPAHTHGDTLVWLPNEKILYTGDVCVNGAYNYIRDGDMAGWIKVLEAARALGAEKVCPGHGPMGGPEILVDQQRYFIELRRGVQALVDAKKSPGEIKAAAPTLAAELKKIESIARYVPKDIWFADQVGKISTELGGAASK